MTQIRIVLNIQDLKKIKDSIDEFKLSAKGSIISTYHININTLQEIVDLYPIYVKYL